MKQFQNSIIQGYINEQVSALKLIYPDSEEKFLEEVVLEELNKNFYDPKIVIDNNYENKKTTATLSSFVKWYDNTKPITTEHGTMFKDHSKTVNVERNFLITMLDMRDEAKKIMLQAKRDGDPSKAELYDLIQKVYKIIANSFFGISGERNSIFYNVNIATAITGKGQSIISTAMTTFENFLAGSIGFNTINDLMNFITFVLDEFRNEPNPLDDYKILHIPTNKELYDRLMELCENKELNNLSAVIKRVIVKLTDEEKQFLYFKNNLFALLREPYIVDKFKTIIEHDSTFRYSADVPEGLEDVLEDIWKVTKYYVFVNKIKLDKIKILASHKRRAVLGCDTDSNFIGVNNHYKIIQEKLGLTRDDEESTFKVISTFTYILSKVIEEAFWTYNNNCNVPEDKRKIIYMKNEFLWNRLVLTKGRKNYANLMRLQEGVLIDFEPDVKGLPFKKSNVNKHTRNELTKILEENILKTEEIKPSEVLEKLFDFEDKIRTSLENGELDFASPGKSKTASEYKEPLSMAGYRSAMLYNLLYPNDPINLPSSFNMLNLKVTKKDEPEMLALKESNEEFYNILVEELFDEETGKLRYNTNPIALPRTITSIPEWIIPLVDIDEIIKSNLRPFYPVVLAIGINTVQYKADDKFISNIIL